MKGERETVVEPVPPDDSPLWDALDTIVNAEDAAEDEEARAVLIRHGRLTRNTAGESEISFDAVDQLQAAGFVTMSTDGGGVPSVDPTDRGRYQLGRWAKRIRRKRS